MPKLASDRGAISTLFAILLGSGVLMGILALVIDGGQVLALRQLTRNAADAVAEAVAIHCAKDQAAANCLADNYLSPTVTNRAMDSSAPAAFLNSMANPQGGQVSVDTVCGRSNRVVLPACPALTGGPTDCATDLGSDITKPEWVRVYTSTGPGGFTPILSNLNQPDTPASYQETACAQVYWGPASAISPTNQLPLMLGVCEAKISAIGEYSQLVGEAAGAACNYSNGQGTAVAATGRGFLQYDPLAASSACWTMGGGTCSALPLGTTKSGGTVYPQLSYSGLIGALNGKLNVPVLVPVVDPVTGGYRVRGFVSFTLVAFKFPLAGSLTKCNTDSYCSVPVASRAGYVNYPWSGVCAATQSTTSPYCIAGYLGTKVVSANGQAVGLTTSSDPNNINLGYQVVRHIQ